MSAPVTDRPRGGTATRRGRTATVPAPRPAVPERAVPERRAPVAPERRDSAAGRAYARRDDRLRRLLGARPARTAAPTGRAKFVLLVMVLLAGGLVATLWLSTAASADSYRLQDARTRTGLLSAQSERLHREVAAAGSATELARRAADLGMVPAEDPARIVVGVDGVAIVVGEPRAAEAPAPVVPPAPPAPAGPDAAGPAAPGPEPADPAAAGPAAGPDATGTYGPDSADTEAAADVAETTETADTAAAVDAASPGAGG